MIAAAVLTIALSQASAGQDRDAVLKSAAAAMSAGRVDEAKRLLRDAGDRFGSVRALLTLARLQSTQGDLQGALDSIRAARRLAPNSEDVLLAYAQVSLAARLPVPAVLALESLARMSPAVAQYHYMLGVALVTAGDMPSASDALVRAQALEPDRPPTLIALGLVYTQQKRYDEAKAALARSLELDPENPEARAVLAEAEAGLDDVPAAERDATRVLSTAPGNARANFVLGMVRMTEQRYADARDALLAASSADPGSAKIDYQLSLAYSRLGDQASAQRHLDLYQQKLRATEAALKAQHDAGFGAGGRQ